MNFAERQESRAGMLGESLIAQYFISKGWSILPAYEKEIDTGKGPRVFTPTGEHIAPDLLMFRANSVVWIEAKHKSRFSWYGIGGYWVTGIDIRHFEDYCKLAQIIDWPILLLFFHRESDAWKEDVKRWDCPPRCPTGLYCGDLTELKESYSHRSDKYGRGGMIYWDPEQHLRQLATIEEVTVAMLNRQMASTRRMATYSPQI